jgi:Beta-Casp domain
VLRRHYLYDTSSDCIDKNHDSNVESGSIDNTHNDNSGESINYNDNDNINNTNANEMSYSQTGVSRHLFERWCDDERNGVVLAGYTVEGTLAHDLLNHPTGKSSKVNLLILYFFIHFQCICLPINLFLFLFISIIIHLMIFNYSRSYFVI